MSLSDVSSLADPELGPPPTASTEGVASARTWNRKRLLILSVVAVAAAALCVAVAVPVSNAKKKRQRADQQNALSAAMGQQDSSSAAEAAAAPASDEDSDAQKNNGPDDGGGVGGDDVGGDPPSEVEVHHASSGESLQVAGNDETVEAWNGTNRSTPVVVDDAPSVIGSNETAAAKTTVAGGGGGGGINETATDETVKGAEGDAKNQSILTAVGDGEPDAITNEGPEAAATGGGNGTTPAVEGEIADKNDAAAGEGDNDNDGTDLVTDGQEGGGGGGDGAETKNASDATNTSNVQQVDTDVVGGTIENSTNGTLQGDGGVVLDDSERPSITARSYRFDAKLRPFSAAVMTPYPECIQLKRDVESALKKLADDYIERNRDRDCRHYYDVYMGGDVPMMSMTRAGAPMAMEASAEAASSNAKAAPSDAVGGEDSYGTNNQVDGVDEADVVKSDGKYIFAAYGSELIMMDAQDLTILDRTTVPDPPSPSKVVQREDEDDGDISLFAAKSIRPGIMPPGNRDPKRTIRSLLLDADTQHVTAITHYESYDYSYRNTRIVGGGVTTSFVYGYGSGEKLRSMGSVDVPGRFSSARSIGRRAHVITSASINTYGFTSVLNPCSNDYRDLYKTTTKLDDGEEKEIVDDKELYREAAFAKASSTVSDYAERIVAELGLSAAGCDRVVRLSTMSGDEEEEERGDEFDDENGEEKASASRRRLDLTDGRGILNGFVRITSFDTTGTGGSSDPASTLGGGGNVGGVSVAGAFVPTSGAAETYANEDVIVVAGRGYRSDPRDSSWSQYTSLMSFDLRGGRAAQGAVGEVRGYLLNQFSMDHYLGLLRIATTNRARWAYVRDERTGERRWQTVSESSSQVTTLRLPGGANGGGRMERVGLLENLGVTERITSCRFVRDRAYVVTFQLKDPLYVIDMGVSKDPKILGELNITGFSSYMHPITVRDRDDHLLTIGQEADPDTGRSTGMKISLFDVSDPTDPREVQKYVINEDDGDGNNRGYSSSAAQWDHHAFRYLDGSKKLILPVSSYRYQSAHNLDGFVVYDVDAARGIEPVGTVTHADDDVINSSWQRYCFGRARLPPRSMVFGGDRLVTFKGHSVRVSRGLTRELRRGPMMNLDEGRDESNGDACYGYFFR